MNVEREIAAIIAWLEDNNEHTLAERVEQGVWKKFAPQPLKPTDAERSPGRQAERIVYAIIKQLSSMSPMDSAGTLGNCWNAAPHVVRAELATKWIEIAEAILKGNP